MARGTGQETVEGRVVGRQVDPCITLPKNVRGLPTGPGQRESMEYGRPRKGSPVVGSGTRITKKGGRDFYGNTVDERGPNNTGPSEGRP